MSQPCRGNCMNAAFMLYGRADPGRGRAGPGVTGARQDAPAPQTPKPAKPRNTRCALTQWNPGFIAYGRGPNVVEVRIQCVRRASGRDRGSGLLLEYRDLALAVGGKGGAVPACPAVPEPEARDPGHEVELGRPDVPVGRGVAHHVAPGFDPVM